VGDAGPDDGGPGGSGGRAAGWSVPLGSPHIWRRMSVDGRSKAPSSLSPSVLSPKSSLLVDGGAGARAGGGAATRTLAFRGGSGGGAADAADATVLVLLLRTLPALWKLAALSSASLAASPPVLDSADEVRLGGAITPALAYHRATASLTFLFRSSTRS